MSAVFWSFWTFLVVTGAVSLEALALQAHEHSSMA